MKNTFDKPNKEDRLKRFVDNNRAAFDSEEPSEELWAKIEPRLNTGPALIAASQPEKNRWKRQFTYDWRVAAAIIVTSLLGLLVYVNSEYGITRDPEMALQLPSYAKQVNHYAQIINDKRSELKKLTANKPELYHEFASELDQLEKTYSGLRSELPESPDPETHLHAMVQNLQWQIDLLNQQIIIIEKIKKANEKEDHNRHVLAI